MKFFNTIKEIWSNPKKKSLAMLLGYIIFFAIVFILIEMGDNSVNSEYIQEDEISKVNNYEYTYKINNNEIIEYVTGTLKNNEDIFNYKGLNYIKKDGIVYLNEIETTIDFNVDDYKYETIELLMENSDFDTIYKDSNKVVYNMSTNEYFSLLNRPEKIIDNLINVSITVESSDYINNVIIDLSNLYGHKYLVEISYNNINKII